jgi:hypothetical protein
MRIVRDRSTKSWRGKLGKGFCINLRPLWSQYKQRLRLSLRSEEVSDHRRPHLWSSERRGSSLKCGRLPSGNRWRREFWNRGILPTSPQPAGVQVLAGATVSCTYLLSHIVVNSCTSLLKFRRNALFASSAYEIFSLRRMPSFGMWRRASLISTQWIQPTFRWNVSSISSG